MLQAIVLSTLFVDLLGRDCAKSGEPWPYYFVFIVIMIILVLKSQKYILKPDQLWGVPAFNTLGQNFALPKASYLLMQIQDFL